MRFSRTMVTFDKCYNLSYVNHYNSNVVMQCNRYVVLVIPSPLSYKCFFLPKFYYNYGRALFFESVLHVQCDYVKQMTFRTR